PGGAAPFAATRERTNFATCSKNSECVAKLAQGRVLVREQPHRVLARKALVTAHGSAPGGAAPFAATRERANFATCSNRCPVSSCVHEPAVMIPVSMVNLLTIGVLAIAIGQSAPRSAAVAGVVQDRTGRVLAGAAVTLSSSGAATATQQVMTDRSGLFRFERVVPGDYVIRSEFPGFTPKETRVRVGARAPSPLTIVLAIEGVTQEVSVSGASA